VPLTLVQGSSLGAWGSATNGASPANAVAVTWAQARTAGNLLVLVYASDGLMPVPAGWTSAVVALDFADMEIVYRIADNTATDAPSLDNNAATCIAWAEYSGNTATPLDVTASGTNNTVTGVQTRSTGTTGATAQADELAVAAWYISSPNPGSWSGQTNSFTEVVDTATSTGQDITLAVAVRALSATGTVESTATSSSLPAPGSGNGLGGAVATFKADAGGGATGHPAGRRLGLAGGCRPVEIGREGTRIMRRPEPEYRYDGGVLVPRAERPVLVVGGFERPLGV